MDSEWHILLLSFFPLGFPQGLNFDFDFQRKQFNEMKSGCSLGVEIRDGGKEKLGKTTSFEVCEMGSQLVN